MELTIRDASNLLNVSEVEIYRWITQDHLPAEQINGQYRFNQTALLEWATKHRGELAPNLASPRGAGDICAAKLEDALRLGGVHYKVPGTDLNSVLRAVVEKMPVASAANRALIHQVLLHREAIGSTAIGDGVALPHPRYPIVLPIDAPFITLCFLEQPIAYSAKSDQPVHTLFALVSPTMRMHLTLLARLASALHAPAFRDCIQRKAPAEQILAEACAVDNAPTNGRQNGKARNAPQHD